MKKEYTSPMLEKVEFNYENQVAASPVNPCTKQWSNIGDAECSAWDQVWFGNQSF